VLDPTTGFGGFGAAFLELVADDYPKAPIILQAVSPGAHGVDAATAVEDLARNHALTLAALHETVGLYVPAAVPTYLRAPWATRYRVRAVENLAIARTISRV